MRGEEDSTEDAHDGWAEHRIEVRSALRRHEGHIGKLYERLEGLDRRVTIVEVKAWFWGALSGAVATVVARLLMKL